MSEVKSLIDFIELAQEDVRIAPTHISLYVAIYYLWLIHNKKNPVSVQREQLMRLSKISARLTFYKCIKELQELGFIKYVPSINQFLESLVYVLDQDAKINSIK